MKDGQSKSVWKDLSGNGNHGELKNFNFTEDSGWVDGGLRFDGVDDYVECQNIFNVDYDSTYEVVVNLKRQTGSYMDILVRNYHWTDSIFVSNSMLRFYLALDGGSSISLDINNIIKYNGEILHITRVFKDGHLYIYIDGELKSKTEKGSKGIPDNNARISPYQISHPDYPINGDIKLVRIYNRALTDEEILQNYQATHFLLEPKTFPPTNSYYNFEDLNRVEINTLATKDLVEALRGEVNLGEIDIDRDMKSIPFADVLNRVEGNINILGNKLYKPKGWIQPKLDWRYNQPFSYEDANRLEMNLLLLYNYAKANVDKIPYCGMINVGEEVI